MHELKMPQLGESIFDGTILEWLKNEGEFIEEYEVLLEVETDKVTTEITSPFTGTLHKILVQPGETVGMGTVLALIGEADETVSEANAAPVESEAPKVSPVAARIAQEENIDLSDVQGSGHGGRITKKDIESLIVPSEQPATNDFISPAVARLAMENNIDLRTINGTGKDGRITKQDVLQAIDGGTPAPQAPPAPRQDPIAQPSNGRREAPLGEVIPLTGMRRSIAEHMVRSVQTSPHVTTVFEVDMSAVVAHREVNKYDFAERGHKLTFTPYFVMATARALRDFPAVNTQWHENGILYHDAVHIGMATALGNGGLIVPVIRNADMKNLMGIARDVNDLAERARNKQLSPDEIQGATFSITNHGTSGSLFATPIINQPQAAILGIGRIQDRVVPIDGNIGIRPMCYISLTFDHRLLDGEGADNFVAHIKDILENWL